MLRPDNKEMAMLSEQIYEDVRAGPTTTLSVASGMTDERGQVIAGYGVSRKITAPDGHLLYFETFTIEEVRSLANDLLDMANRADEKS